jgi:hypothetical protein
MPVAVNRLPVLTRWAAVFAERMGPPVCDASLFMPRTPSSDLVARRAGVAPWGYCSNAVRRMAASGAEPGERSLRHSKSGRGRSSCR